MNERNVDALEGILNSNVLFRYTQRLDSLRELAAYLASRGVLVPAALTDEQIWRFDGVQMLPHTEEPAAMRAYLERIAKGEPNV